MDSGPTAQGVETGGLPPLAGLHALVAEDSEVMRLVLEAMLVDLGARVTMVDNGWDAVSFVIGAPADPVDLVLMDVEMPVMDGLSATRAILKAAPGTPVIGQTGHESDDDAERCFEAGMVAHLVKPIDPDALVESALQCLQHRRSGEAPWPAAGAP